MALTIKLSLDHTALVAETANGHEISLPADPTEAYAMLLHMLQTQAKPKVVAPPVSQTANTTLADWVRVGPAGAGKVRIVKLDKRGKVVVHNKPVELF